MGVNDLSRVGRCCVAAVVACPGRLSLLIAGLVPARPSVTVTLEQVLPVTWVHRYRSQDVRAVAEMVRPAGEFPQTFQNFDERMKYDRS